MGFVSGAGYPVPREGCEDVRDAFSLLEERMNDDLIAVIDIATHLDHRTVADAGLNRNLFDLVVFYQFEQIDIVLTQYQGVPRHRYDLCGFAARQFDADC